MASAPKKFDMPGQTKELDPNAADAEALKIFYSTLHKQRPESEMASRWLLQHGLLERDEAERLCKILLKTQKKTSDKPAQKRQRGNDDDFVSAPKPKAKAKAANGKKKLADSSEDEFEKPAKKAKASASKPVAKPVQKPVPKPAAKAAAKTTSAATKKQAADSSDEEDLPLSQRKLAQQHLDSSDEDDLPLSHRTKRS